MDVIASLEQTFAHTSVVVAGVRVEQQGDKTPCAEWTVRELLEHMIAVVAGFGSAAGGQAAKPFVLGDDPATPFDEAASMALAAWRTPGVLDRVVDGGPGPMPGSVLAGINLLDTATHAWDLATATGQPAELPESVAVAALAAQPSIVSPETRAGRDGPQPAAPPAASPTARLVAFRGRTP